MFLWVLFEVRDWPLALRRKCTKAQKHGPWVTSKHTRTRPAQRGSSKTGRSLEATCHHTGRGHGKQYRFPHLAVDAGYALFGAEGAAGLTIAFPFRACAGVALA